MSRQGEHLDVLLRHLGAAYYQTLHGGAAAWEVNRAVASVEAVQAGRPAGRERQRGRWRVRDVMAVEPVTVTEDTPAREIARLMSARRVGAVPVLSAQGLVLGVVSEGDLLRSRQRHASFRYWIAHGTHGRGGRTAAALMTSPAVTIGREATLAAAARRMTDHHVWLLPVVTEAGDLLGVVSRRNLLSIFLRPDADIAAEVRQVLTGLLLIDETSVQVAAAGGRVTLSGRVASEGIRATVVRIASEVDGVTQVTDELRTHTPAHT